MNLLIEAGHNKILIAAVIGWAVAQILKTIIYVCLNREFVAERLIGSGGMPSSHSATVCALATATGIQYGGGSFEFAIALVFAIVVMYDATGVRRETGIQAKVLNEMIELFKNMGSKMKAQDKLKEFIGHSPLQVLAGAILGILIAYLVMFSK
ncbi:MAG: divergent PAP2 family protein [Lachnospiraceae bacterium]